MRNTVNTADMGHIHDDATAEVSQITLKHDEISTELYTGHVFPAHKLAPTADRHHGTRIELRAIGIDSIQLDIEPRDSVLSGTHRQATQEAAIYTRLLEEMRGRDKE